MEQSALLDVLAPSEREALTARLRPRSYRRGDIVFNDGDQGDCMHLVQSGRFDVQFTTVGGQRITLRVVQPGQIFGEMAVVHPDHRRVGRVTALEDAETLVLLGHDFELLRQKYPGIDRFLVVALADRVRRTTELVVESMLPPERRLWRRLAHLAEAYGTDTIRMSQDDLAAAAGTVRQTANRVLRQGVKDGILELDRGSITVLDREGLDRRARQE